MTGRVIAGRYNLQHPIGRGAMGVVWRARDQLLDREVAVKEVVISALIGADERHNAYQRTLREARTAARLSHRGVVTVYDVAEEDGRPWIVMELVPSQSLDQVLTVEGRLTAARAGRIGQQLLSALAAAHTAGVLHRDVKPSNVLIATDRTGDGWDERAVLTDFGIAQFEGDPRLTQTGMVMGSPGFTAPERIRGGDATPGSDLWSLGATIYAAVEGRGPYEKRGGAITTMSAIINEDAPVATHAGQLAPVIAALLRRDPSTRPSASVAARMFAQVLPRLADVTAEPPAAAHPATVRAAFLPLPAAPGAAVRVTASEDAAPNAAPGAGPGEMPASAAAERPAADEPAAEESALEAPDSPTAAEAASQSSADSAVAAEYAEVAESVLVASGAVASGVLESGATESEAPAPEIAEVQVPEAALAEAAAGEQKAAGATLLDERPVGDGARAGSGDTVFAGEEPAGYLPTEVSIPVARMTPAAPPRPAQPQPAQPQPAQPTRAQPKPAQPKPTFTAAKPTDRVTPTFSAASPPRPVRPPVAPPPDPRPAYGSGSAGQAGHAGQAGQGYPPAGGAPFPPSGGQYGPPAGGEYGPLPGGQYGGPAQSYPDLAGQYTPGTVGGRAGRGRGARGRGARGREAGRRIAWLVVAVLVAAAIGIGAALALNRHPTDQVVNTGSTGVADTTTQFKSVNSLNNPSAVLPAGWSTQTVQAADANSTAGFSVDLPAGWTEKRASLATWFYGPKDMVLEIDLTPQTTTDMRAAAGLIAAKSHFADYKLNYLQEVPVLHTHGAIWQFTFTLPKLPRLIADDIFFLKPTSAGSQYYAVYIRAPYTGWSSEYLPRFDEILRTFQTIPS
jgi:eukaryotic-like serine/threonine-protein kinase